MSNENEEVVYLPKDEERDHEVDVEEGESEEEEEDTDRKSLPIDFHVLTNADCGRVINDEGKTKIIYTKTNILAELILPNLSTLELSYVERVNKMWRENVKLSRKSAITSLQLKQFWSILKNENLKKFEQLIDKYENLSSLSFSYCHNAEDESICSLIGRAQNCPTNNLLNLNLFFCIKITDKTLEYIIEKTPNIKFLHLGRCANITEEGIKSLKALKSLKRLNLAYNTNLTDSSLEEFKNRDNFPSLNYLNIKECSIPKAKIEAFVKAVPHIEVNFFKKVEARSRKKMSRKVVN